MPEKLNLPEATRGADPLSIECTGMRDQPPEETRAVL